MAFFNFSVPEDTEKIRLDKFLSGVLPQYSRSFLAGKCRLSVNDIVARPSKIVTVNDQIQVAVPALKDLKIKPEKIPLKIIYEDADLIVIDKPAGMVVHPTDHGGHVTGTLVNALLFHCGKKLTVAAKERPGIVHRLDRDTSGLIVAAKTEKAKAGLTSQFADRKVKKIYLALVSGNIKDERGRIEAPIGRKVTDRTRRTVRTGSDAKEAVTEFEVVERFGTATLLKVRILTGRTHQIRVHFVSLGHPVVGDTTYGYKKSNLKFNCPRQFLHANFLTFMHPVKNKQVEFESPLPADLSRVLNQLRVN